MLCVISEKLRYRGFFPQIYSKSKIEFLLTTYSLIEVQ